jgi:hypothetical protein
MRASQDTASLDLTDLVAKKGKAGGRSTHFVQRLLGMMDPYIPLDEVVPIRFGDYIAAVDRTFEKGLGR